MAANMAVNILRQGICKIQPFTVFRRQFAGTIVVFNNQQGQSQSSSSSDSSIADVPGLSTAVHTNEEPVGPNATKAGEYKVPEYFNFNKNSYFEAEVEMQKYRCPQPSAVQK